MSVDSVQIVDRGRGPQLSTTRITVLDIFYYLRRGRDFAYIREAMPSLSRHEFDVAVEYINGHYDELVRQDDKAEEFVRKGVEAQRARGGIFAEPDDLTTEQRVSRLRELMNQRATERNGARHSC